MPKRPCRQPGCPNLNCKEHRAKRLDARPSAASRGYGRRWQRLRLMFLRANPLCADPFGLHANSGEVAMAEHADHIKPKRDGGQDKWDNLQGLCHSCHSKKTALGG
jgi:5-methylcytosine-specific restriction protein A